jgi:hypothetical protein
MLPANTSRAFVEFVPVAPEHVACLRNEIEVRADLRGPDAYGLIGGEKLAPSRPAE